MLDQSLLELVDSAQHLLSKPEQWPLHRQAAVLHLLGPFLRECLESRVLAWRVWAEVEIPSIKCQHFVRLRFLTFIFPLSQAQWLGMKYSGGDRSALGRMTPNCDMPGERLTAGAASQVPRTTRHGRERRRLKRRMFVTVLLL